MAALLSVWRSAYRFAVRPTVASTVLVFGGLGGAACGDHVSRTAPWLEPVTARPTSSQDPSSPPSLSAQPPAAHEFVGPGFPNKGPWVSFYGRADEMGDIQKVARTFRIINIDADPSTSNFTDAQITTLKSDGANRVISYMNVGACEHFRPYWKGAPEGFLPCAKLEQLGAYEGYKDETWMNPADARYQKLIVEHVARKLVARGVDGFYLDNLELLGHSSSDANGPCNPACRQGGLDLVRKLRERYPSHLIVMQNGTGDATRTGITGGISFPALLDGIAHEEVYAPKFDEEAEQELLSWKKLQLKNRSGREFWIATEDYVGHCKNQDAARRALSRAKERGFSPYATDASAGQKVVCFWDE